MLSSPFQTVGEAPTGKSRLRTVRALEHIRRMRGGAQSQLIRCSDGNYYVVKFPNNPQGSRILVNELLGTRFAEILGLPVAQHRVVMVSEELITYTEELVIEMGRGRIPCQPGPCFGSRFAADPREAVPQQILPDEKLREVENIGDFLGMLILDLWTCNTDRRQVIFVRSDKSSRYRAVMIDQGGCFNSSEWNFPDSPLRGRYWNSAVYENVLGMAAFEPWLDRLESQSVEKAVLSSVGNIPPAWCESESSSLDCLLNKLITRRTRVRELLWSAIKSTPRAFPKWVDSPIQIKEPVIKPCVPNIQLQLLQVYSQEADSRSQEGA